MSIEKNWYALYTQENCERKVCKALNVKNIESFFPQNRVVKSGEGRHRFTLKPLFSRYVFFYGSAKDFETVRKTRGVVNIVYWHREPAVIDKTEILLLKEFLRKHNNIVVNKTSIGISDINDLIHPSHNEKQREDHNQSSSYMALPSFGYHISGRMMERKVFEDESSSNILNSLKYFMNNINYLYRQ